MNILKTGIDKDFKWGKGRIKLSVTEAQLWYIYLGLHRMNNLTAKLINEKNFLAGEIYKILENR